MSRLDPDDVYTCFKRALYASIEFRKSPHITCKKKVGVKNRLASSKFLSEVCLELNKLPIFKDLYDLNLIKILQDDKDGYRRCSGEWLLDATWTSPKESNDISFNLITQIHCALECESNKNNDEFYKDFSKLLVIQSPIKIFAGGLDQQKGDHMRYIEERIHQVESLLLSSELRRQESMTDWYLVFWPSPSQKNKKWESMWYQMYDDPKYEHLNDILLYHRPAKNSRFKRIHE